MKILIADDEPKIRKGLKKFIVENFKECEEIKVAKDGLEALDICKRFVPDIILTDIRMPKLDGLEFISKVLEENSDSVVIVITGYDEFKYAQEAVRLKVYDFLLKPIDTDKTKKIINKAYTEIINKRELADLNTFARKSLNDSIDDLISNIYQKIINKEMDDKEYVSYHKILNKKLPYGKTSVMGVRIINNIKKNDNNQKKVTLKGLENKLLQIYDDIKLEDNITYIYKDEIIISIFNNKKVIDYNQIYKEVNPHLSDNLNYEILMEHVDMNDLIRDLECAMNILWNKLHENSRYSSMVYEAKKFLEKNYYDENLSLKKVAAKLSINASYLSRIFHKELGISFGEYLTDLRLDYAVELIRTSEKDVKIYEISNKIGYSSQHYFSRVFKKKFGVSPIDYMKEVKDNE